ncbi:hypothetical protein VP01_722g7 [Puccinia sorghi]|uniref:Uncharacterized protein n=1 Tax=Puccinia sorghi TaxID=27349 RepID=A0A0L6UD83_9BASI|nr:hypothetical protein VP01_722g7 [Puccinia sorghi]
MSSAGSLELTLTANMSCQANKYKHCTLPYSSPSSTFTCLRISFQINFSLSNICNKGKQGHYNKPLDEFGDNFLLNFSLLPLTPDLPLFTTIVNNISQS